MVFSFIEPMLLLAAPSLPYGWVYELKLDGYRALAAKVDGRVFLRSRNDNDFSERYPTISKALAALPANTVLDGEVVALDANGMPSFNLLQHAGSNDVTIVLYVFDLLVHDGKDVMGLPLRERRKLLEEEVLPHVAEPIRGSMILDAPLKDLVVHVKRYGFEGLVAKNPQSRYEPGKRSGAWQKMRLNRGQELVIGGYTIGGNPFDAIILGYHDDYGGLHFAAKTRNGFTPASRASLYRRMQPLITAECPFLPEKRAGRWGQGITAEKMKECVWLKPQLVAQVEFVEWTPDNHLRHASFKGLREDKDPKQVVREAV